MTIEKPFQPQILTLPDLPALWPFKAAPILPLDEIVAESNAWVASYSPFTPKAQAAFFKCKFGSCAWLVYPRISNREHLRAAVDLLSLYYVIDLYTDDEDAPTANKRCDDVMAALRNPYATFAKDDILGRMTSDFWLRTIEDAHATPSTQRRFLDHFEHFLNGVRQQAADRDHKQLRSIEDYMVVRRGTGAVRSCFDFCLIQQDLPDELYSHPNLDRIITLAEEVIIYTNDIYSWPVESRSSDPYHNLVPVTMNEKGLTTQEAVDHISDRFKMLTKEFLFHMMHMPELPGPVSKVYTDFVMDIAVWVEGHIQWSFVSERYFGSRGLEVREKKQVAL